MAQPANSEALTVRPATVADASRLAPLAVQLGYPSTVDQVAARLREILPHADHLVLVAERKGGYIAGYIEVFPFCTIGTNPRIEIASLVVDETCRSQGVGRLLIDRAEEWARANGYKEMGLRSNVIRDRAHRFYENLGYRVNKTQKSFRKTL